MKQYKDLLKHVLDHGDKKIGRNGLTFSCFDLDFRHNMEDGFPAVTTKELIFESVLSELLWFIEGSSDERRLCELRHGSRDKKYKTVWTGNAHSDYWNERGLKKFNSDLGPVYGPQWRSWTNQFGEKIDQLKNLIEGIKKEPNGRRHVVQAYNPGDVNYMALPPCHMGFTIYISGKKMSLKMQQRSADMYLGVPFNIASYAILLQMIAKMTGYQPHMLSINMIDAHIYSNHLDAVHKQLNNEPFDHPYLWLNPDVKSIFDYTMEDVALEDYSHHGKIPAKMAV